MCSWWSKYCLMSNVARYRMSWSVWISFDMEKNFENLPIFEVSKKDFIEFKEKHLETSGNISLDVYLMLNRIYMCNCKLVVVFRKWFEKDIFFNISCWKSNLAPVTWHWINFFFDQTKWRISGKSLTSLFSIENLNSSIIFWLLVSGACIIGSDWLVFAVLETCQLLTGKKEQCEQFIII